MRPPPQVFERGWPAGYSREALDPYFDLAAYMLDVRPAPDTDALETPRSDGEDPVRFKTRRMRDLAEADGRGGDHFRPNLAVNFDGPDTLVELRSTRQGARGSRLGAPVRGRTNAFGVPQGQCTGCAECDLGCNEHAKNTLDLNYLAVAEGRAPATYYAQEALRDFKPARVRTRAEVKRLEAREDGWAVRYHDRLTDEERVATARAVFLAAGAVNSTELVLKSDLPLAHRERAGGGFFANADSVATIFDTEAPHRAHEGPTITTALLYDPDPDDEDEERTPWFLIEDGGLPESLLGLIGYFRAHPQARAETAPPGDPELLSRCKAGLDALSQLTATGPEDAASLSAMLPAVVPELASRVDAFARGALADVLSGAGPVASKFALKTLRSELEKRHPWWMLGFVRRWVVAEVSVRARGLAKEGKLVTPELLNELVAMAVTELQKRALFDTEPHHRAICLMMGRDLQAGRLRYDRETGTLLAEWDVEKNRPVYTMQERLLRDLARREGEDADAALNPFYTLGNQPLTVHPQGGLPIGDPERGVASPDGEIYGCAGLYVVDAAALPRSIGANPSATILAVAERNVARAIPRLRGEDAEAWVAPEREAVSAFKAARFGDEPMEPLDRVYRDRPGPSRPPSPGFGFRFSEKLRGHVAASALDYEHGEARGRKLGPAGRLFMQLTAKIEDLGLFLDHPEHRVEAEGFLEWGRRRFEVTEGSFYQLFPESGRVELEDGRTRETLRYTIHFEGGPPGAPVAPYTLTGTKVVLDHAGFDALADLTTLAVALQRRDGTGEVHRGVVRVRLMDFLQFQLPSFRVTGFQPNEAEVDVAEALRGHTFSELQDHLRELLRFSGFFFGTAATTYAEGYLRQLLRRPR